ncbi:hypothetical protein Tco_0848512 [Tanacetum coccineum]
MSWSQKSMGEVDVEAFRCNRVLNTTTDEFFVCLDYDMVNLAHDDSSWILDSGATYLHFIRMGGGVGPLIGSEGLEWVDMMAVIRPSRWARLRLYWA